MENYPHMAEKDEDMIMDIGMAMEISKSPSLAWREINLIPKILITMATTLFCGKPHAYGFFCI
jgi:hypothetical protein